ncbi:MAG: hypothetical protein R3236_04965, partial [Phycisphaeraceae bacterium]|nr:hypothetical protein [Phycisphaeraceae bacterium]
MTDGLFPTLAAGGWRWWLGLERIDPSSGQVQLEWQHAVPAWGWVLIVAGLGAAAAFSYRKMLGGRRARAALTGVRILTLVAVALLLAGPVLVLPKDQAEESRVLILLDRSESMTFKDLDASGRGPGHDLSRDAQLRGLLNDNEAVWQNLADEHTLQWFAFGDDVRKLEGPVTEPIAAGGSATLMRSAIDESLSQATGRRIGAVVILSDGRSSEPLDMKIQRRLQREAESVFVVPLGSPTTPQDLVLRTPEVPRRVFVKDVVPVRVVVDRVGGAESPPAPAAGTRVRLIDTTSG